jgi:hypothetical protein
MTGSEITVLTQDRVEYLTPRHTGTMLLQQTSRRRELTSYDLEIKLKVMPGTNLSAGIHWLKTAGARMTQELYPVAAGAMDSIQYTGRKLMVRLWRLTWCSSTSRPTLKMTMMKI